MSAWRSIIRPANPLFWVLIALLIWGSVQIGSLIGAGLARFPTGVTLAIVIFALYAVPYILVIRSSDRLEREPWPLLLLAFAWGALVATAGALPSNKAIAGLLAQFGGLDFATTWTPAIAAPTTEETLKTLGVVVIVLLARREITTVLDGVVYGAVVGLGFQVVENVVYCIKAIAMAGGVDQITPVLQMLALRGFLSGLWSHAMYSAIIGAGIGYFVVRTNRPLVLRLFVAVLCFAIGWGLHFVWNSPLLTTGITSGAGVVAVILLKGAFGMSVLLVIYLLARRSDRAWFRTALGSETGAITVEQVEELMSGRRRRGAVRRSRRAGGADAAAAHKRLQKAQFRLVAALGREGTDGPTTARARDDVIAAQTALDESLATVPVWSTPHAEGAATG